MIQTIHLTKIRIIKPTLIRRIGITYTIRIRDLKFEFYLLFTFHICYRIQISSNSYHKSTQLIHQEFRDPIFLLVVCVIMSRLFFLTQSKYLNNIIYSSIHNKFHVDSLALSLSHK